jgi:tetratricopeptide (TPR) repeat protein
VATLLGSLIVGTIVFPAVFVAGRPKLGADQIWRNAEVDLQNEHIDKAEAAVAKLAHLRSPTPNDWMLRAQVAMARSRTDEALADLAKVPDDDPLGAQARLMAGQLELRRYRTRSAEALFHEAIRIDPKIVQARKELIYIYGVQLRRKELAAQFLALSQLVPLTFDNAFHWCLTRNTMWEPLELTRMMERFLKADPDDRWSRLSLAESQRQLHHLDEADKAVAALPDSDSDALAIRVRVALDRNDERAAEALLAKAPKDHAELARLAGRLALAHGDATAAVRFLRAAYRAEPDNRDILVALANALALAGDPEAGKIRTASRNHDVLGTLMQRASINANRRDPKLLRQLGAACEAIQRLPEARTWYNLAIGLDPLDKEAQQALFRLNATLSSRPPSKAGL